MLQSIWDDIKQEYNYGNMIKRIIIVNIAIYVFINLVWVFLNGVYPALYDGIVRFFSISSSPWHLLTHPWSIITHMFLHEGFMHLLWNMLFLFWFGRIFGDLLGDRRVLPLYILGGLGGAFFYFVTANLGLYSSADHTGFALGASAAVMSILVAAGVFAPDYDIRLLFIGNVKLKWIVLALVFMNILGTQAISNAGGSWGHLGGITVGFLYAYQLQRGTDWTEPLQRWITAVENFFRNLWAARSAKQRPGPRAAYRRGEAVKSGKSRAKSQSGKRSSDYSTTSASHQEKLDAILDKIKERGYESLSQEEKDFLFRASND